MLEKTAKFKTNGDKPAPSKNETAWGESAFLSFGGNFESFNPDVLVGKKGTGIYRKMLNDAQVKAVYNLVVNIIISRQYNFVKQSDDPMQDDIIEFFNHNLDIVLRGTWIKSLKSVMLGKAQGYSVSEKIWQVGQFKKRDYWFIRSIKSRPYETFQFQLDDFDNVKALIQDQRGSDKRLNPKKFIIYINNPDLDPVWGDSDLKAAYRPYWVKDIVNKFWSIWLERIAGGFLVATPEKDAPALSPLQRNKLEKMLQNVQKATGFMVPQGWNLDVKDGQDTDAFEKAITVQNREIAKALLVPDLLGFSERGTTGSRALGDTQFNSFMMIVKEQGDYLADVMNEQFFSQLAWYNFGVKDFPIFKFENFTVDQRRDVAKAWSEAASSGVVVNTFEDEERTRELLLYGKREKTKDEPNEQKKPEPNEQEKPKPNEQEQEKPKADETDEKLDAASPVAKFVEGATQSFESRIDFVELKTEFDDNEKSFVKDMSAPYGQMFKEIDAYYKVTIKNLPSDKNKIKYDKISVGLAAAISDASKAALSKTIDSNLRVNYELGRAQAKETLMSAIKAQPKATRDKLTLAMSLTKSMACANEHWNVANFIDGVDLEAVAEWIRSKAFTITGDLSNDLVAQAQQILIDGITEEKSYKAIVDDLREVLPTTLGTPNAAGQVTEKSNRARLETIARTNITTAFNQAQLSVYAEPQLGDFVAGLEYAATLDSRTTEFCNAYNGRRFKRNDPVWSTITPPNHFNCRSVMIPITVFDRWKPSKTLASVRPAKGFN